MGGGGSGFGCGGSGSAWSRIVSSATVCLRAHVGVGVGGEGGGGSDPPEALASDARFGKLSGALPRSAHPPFDEAGTGTVLGSKPQRRGEA